MQQVIDSSTFAFAVEGLEGASYNFVDDLINTLARPFYGKSFAHVMDWINDREGSLLTKDELVKLGKVNWAAVRKIQCISIHGLETDMFTLVETLERNILQLKTIEKDYLEPAITLVTDMCADRRHMVNPYIPEFDTKDLDRAKVELYAIFNKKTITLPSEAEDRSPLFVYYRSSSDMVNVGTKLYTLRDAASDINVASILKAEEVLLTRVKSLAGMDEWNDVTAEQKQKMASMFNEIGRAMTTLTATLYLATASKNCFMDASKKVIENVQ